MPPAVIASEMRHVDHGALAGLRPCGSRMIGEAVGDRLDAGVGAAAQRVGAQEEQRACRPCPSAAERRRVMPVRHVVR